MLKALYARRARSRPPGRLGMTMEKATDKSDASPTVELKAPRSLEDISRKVRLALLSGQEFDAEARTRGVDPYNSDSGTTGTIGRRRR